MDLSTNISNFLRASTDAVRFELLNHHALWGFAYKNPARLGLIDSTYAKSIYLKQWLQNQTYQKVVAELKDDLLNIDPSVLALKGINHLDDLYKDDIALRFMSDIDLLINPEKFDEIVQYFELKGYRKNQSKKWYGDQHKLEVYKNVDGVDITIELHTKLFYHLKEFDYSTVKNSNGFNQLALEERLVYLCTHYCFQHTMLKLYWFVDIAVLIERNPSIDWNKCQLIARKWRVEKSFEYVIGAINQHWRDLAPDFRGRFQNIIDLRFMFNTNQRSLKYLILKNLVKDNFITTLKYNFLWLKSSQSK